MKPSFLISSLALLVSLGFAPLSAATQAVLPASSVQLIQNSKSLEVEDLATMLHELALLNPECADQILEAVLNTRDAWSDSDLAAIFASIVSALPETSKALAQVPEEVQRAIETKEVNKDAVTDAMGIALLNVIATTPVVDDEQRSRVGSLISDAVLAISDIDTVNRIANGELSDAFTDTDDEVTQAKEDPQSHSTVVEEFVEAQVGSSAGSVTPAQ